MSRFFVSPVGKAIPFDNNGTSFVSTDVDEAIKEAKTVAANLPRYAIVTVFNGTVSNNQWLGYSNLVPGDDVPIIVPITAVLKEVTFANSNSSVDGQVRFYKNGTAGGNIVGTESFSNDQNKTFTPNLSFASGDTLRARWVDQGQNPSDAVIVYFFQAQE